MVSVSYSALLTNNLNDETCALILRILDLVMTASHTLDAQVEEDAQQRADLVKRAEAATKRVLAEGDNKERKSLAEKLEITAEAYGHGAALDREVAAQLRAMVTRLLALLIIG